METDPNNDDARFDLVKLLLELGQDDDAKVAFAPVIAKSAAVRRLDSLNRWMKARDAQDMVVDPQALAKATGKPHAVSWVSPAPGGRALGGGRARPGASAKRHTGAFR